MKFTVRSVHDSLPDTHEPRRLSPDDADCAGCANVRVACEQRKRQRPGGRDDQRIERIAREAQLVGEIDLFRRQVERVVGRVAEEIVAKGTNRPPQVDPAGARQQAYFPDHGYRYVDERLLPLAGREVGRGPASQRRAGGSVKEQGVCIGDGGREISHGGVNASRAEPVRTMGGLRRS